MSFKVTTAATGSSQDQRLDVSSDGRNDFLLDRPFIQKCLTPHLFLSQNRRSHRYLRHNYRNYHIISRQRITCSLIIKLITRSAQQNKHVSLMRYQYYSELALIFVLITIAQAIASFTVKLICCSINRLTVPTDLTADRKWHVNV